MSSLLLSTILLAFCVCCVDSHARMVRNSNRARAASSSAKKSSSVQGTTPCVQNVPSPVAPTWPNTWMTNWTMYTTFSRDFFPPYENGVPPPPYQAARGSAAYDWSLRAIREDYYDFCIPIFETPSEFATTNNFPCSFVNVNGISYMLTYGAPLHAPSCCIFLKPWAAPRPDFISRSSGHWAASYSCSSTINRRQVDWYTVADPISQGPAGPFGYGFYNDTATPAAFYFGALIDTFHEGMCTQNFFNWTANVPPASTWVLPSECATADFCPDWLWPSAENSANPPPYGFYYHWQEGFQFLQTINFLVVTSFETKTWFPYALALAAVLIAWFGVGRSFANLQQNQ